LKVAPTFVQPAPQPGVAHFFLHLQHAAEFDGDATARLRFADAIAREISHAAVDVVAQLAFELPLHSSSSARQEIEELPHRTTPLR
jgi:hypothetical protein